jgi:isopenicillin N synthase-like dioxygenase
MGANKMTNSKIPVIDFSLFSNGNQAEKQTVIKEIYQACHQIGFMYLQNHFIPEDLIEQVFTKSKNFFDLPLEAKQKLAWSNEISNQGYVGMERERLNPEQPGDLKEAFNIGRQEEKRYTSAPVPSSQSLLPNFYNTCTQLANKVLQAFAIALELPEDFFTTNHSEKHHTLRLLHYPPLQQAALPGQVRAGEHSDYGSITLLFQDNNGGLEIQTPSGEWIMAPVIPGTVIVNTGDLMQRWTNNIFCSAKHRVMIPPDDKANESRYSIGFFCHPNNNTEITCLKSCHREHSPIYPPILAGEYLVSRLQASY